MEEDHDAAMRQVLDNMGRHARQAKARRYTPKPVPKPATPDPHDMTTGEMSEAEFQQLLNRQHNADREKDLEVQR